SPVQANGADHNSANLGALLRHRRRHVPDLLASTGRLHFRLSGPQLAAFLISATMRDSSSDVSFVTSRLWGLPAGSTLMVGSNRHAGTRGRRSGCGSPVA